MCLSKLLVEAGHAVLLSERGELADGPSRFFQPSFNEVIAVVSSIYTARQSVQFGSYLLNLLEEVATVELRLLPGLLSQLCFQSLYLSKLFGEGFAELIHVLVDVALLDLHALAKL